MAFATNYKDVNSNDFTPVPEGEYEVLITKSELGQDNYGAHIVDMQLTIRNDVEQPCQNRIIFNAMRRVSSDRMTDSDKMCDGFFAPVVQGLSKAAQLPEGKSYDSIGAWAADLLGVPVRVTIKHSAYNGKTYANARYFNATKFPTVNHKRKAAAAPSAAAVTQQGATQVQDDDCPF